ncbi:Major facilitator super domain-containing protein 12 [Schistosoma haematobium]|uniref:Major facilitator super domain-containing protein 12 n=1 Tax=Schistosoma haematobium TaxID=6185 RepID=A0A922INK7_SCHHA|nr:Major facilitator super domain-containing protein 12 [Schistosoma haematobium]KAH9583541.1 Major facilitator super domain-containing protein 12 [Schistosoma haematobium]
MESSERTLLTSLRYLFTVLSNLLVYISTFLLLQHQHHVDNNNNNIRNDTSIKNSMNDMLPLRKLLNYNEVEYIMLPMVMTSHPLSKCSNSSLSSPSIIDFGKDDIPAFQKLGFTIIGVGGLTMLLFHFGVRKKDFIHNVRPITIVDNPNHESVSQIKHPAYIITTWKDWLRLPLFWILGFFYMFVRLIVNVSQASTVYLMFFFEYKNFSI